MAIVSSKLLSFLCFLLIFMSLAKSQPADFIHHECINDNGNFTANSTYHTNLNTLLSKLSSNTQIDYGFYNFSFGQIPNKVNAIGMCRGDVKVDACLSCLNDSSVLLTKLCPNQKEAIGWYDNCTLRYTNRFIFGIMETYPFFHRWNKENASDVDQFNEDLRVLLEVLRSRAASGDSRRKFAAANASGPSFQTIYVHVQCTPDLSEVECNDCLVREISDISRKPNSCGGKIRCRIWTPSCNLRFDTHPYYDAAAVDAEHLSLPSPPSSINATSPEGKSNSSRTLVIAILVPIVAIVVLVVLVCICIRMTKPRRDYESEAEADDGLTLTETFHFDFETINVATDNFSDANKLGQGGFGVVYKGTLPNGEEIAIKRLSSGSSQGDREFRNEVLLVAKLQHRNLTKLLGFCSEKNERLLVYEFLPNKSLDYYIFDPIKRLHLDWLKRYNIIEGIARGLHYLHEDSRLRIIHRDLKANNILLDENMNSKISDFGMARHFIMDQTHSNTHKIVGTYGYMSPEYALYGKFSMKSDVFSFGVLVLEIVSGQKNSGIRNGEYVEHLVSYAWKNWRKGTVTNIVDPTLNDGPRNDIMRSIHIGLLCVQENAADRPTMASVVLMLSSYSLSLRVPLQPGYFVHTGLDIPTVENNEDAETTRSRELRSNHVEASVNKASITDLSAR